MDKLHPDIILNILSRLPVESVFQCKLVCKPWKTILRNTKMGILFSIALTCEVEFYYGDQYDEINIDDVDEHDDYSFKTLRKIDHPPVLGLMGGSCNGLVCLDIPTALYSKMYDPIYISNPITGEYVHLPRLTIDTYDGWCDLMSGFGYHHSTNEYKVVRIYYDYEKILWFGQAQVYTLGSGTGWRHIGDISHLLNGRSICANGYIYWLDIINRSIVAFNLADEEFRVLRPSPPFFHHHNTANFELKSRLGLKLLGGRVCVVYTEPGKCVEIWVLKNMKKNISYDEKEQEYHSCSWSREFNIAWEGPIEGTHYIPVALTNSNKLILWYNRILSCYDPKTATLKKLWDENMGLKYEEAIPHMNSLVSLKALGEKSERRR